MPEFKRSTRKTSKYMVKTPSGKWVHFGSALPLMGQYKDSTGLGLYSHLDHNDKQRRKRYLARAKGIKDKNGNLTKDNPESANYYSIRFLWT